MHTCPKCGHEAGEKSSAYRVDAKSDYPLTSGDAKEWPWRLTDSMFHQLRNHMDREGAAWGGDVAVWSWISWDEHRQQIAHLSTAQPVPAEDKPTGAAYRW